MKPYWKYIIVSLILGWFIGAACGLLIQRYCAVNGKSMRHFGGPMRERLYKKLDLSAEQKTRVDAILKESREKLSKISGDTRPKIEEIRNAAKTQIRLELNPSQQEKFDKLHARMEERRKKRMERREKWRTALRQTLDR
jgi:hypothetical protein